MKTSSSKMPWIASLLTAATIFPAPLGMADPQPAAVFPGADGHTPSNSQYESMST